MDDKPEEKQRKTISISHRAAGGIGLTGLAIALAPYFEKTFITKQEGAVMAVQVEYIRKDITEVKSMLDSNTQRILNEIKDSDKRTVRNEDRIERRVDMVESILRMKSTR